MAALTWYVTNNLASVHQEMSETSPGAEATASPQTGWIVGNATGNHSPFDAQTNQALATFVNTNPPDGSIDTSAGDCWRTTNTYSGSFAAGNWNLHFACRGVTQAGAQDGRVRYRLFRGANADGSGATEITAAQQQGGLVTNLLTSATQTSTATFNPGAFSVSNEYIFVQLAWERTGAGGMTTTDVAMRIGVTTGSRVISSDFSAIAAGESRLAGAGGMSITAHTFNPSLIRISPDADDADGTWTTDTGGTNLFASVDEQFIPIDTDYIQSAVDPVADVCRVRLSNPGSTMAMPASVTVRAKGEGTTAITVRLKEGSTLIAEWEEGFLPSEFTTFSYDLLQAEFDAIGDPDNLFIELQADEIGEAETIAWMAAVVTNGGTVSSARALLVDDLIVGLKADGVWTKLDRLWLFAAENTGSALTDIVATALAIENGSPTFTTDRGYSGGTVWIDSGFNPSSASGRKWAQDSASLFAWNDVAATGAGLLCGISQAFIQPATSGATNLGYRVNSTATITKSNISNTLGLWHANRAVSTDIEIYQNGSLFSSDASTSAAVVSANITFLAQTGGVLPLPDGEVSCGGFGSSLDATEADALYDRLRTYMTAVGVP